MCQFVIYVTQKIDAAESACLIRDLMNTVARTRFPGYHAVTSARFVVSVRGFWRAISNARCHATTTDLASIDDPHSLPGNGSAVDADYADARVTKSDASRPHRRPQRRGLGTGGNVQQVARNDTSRPTPSGPRVAGRISPRYVPRVNEERIARTTCGFQPTSHEALTWCVV